MKTSLEKLWSSFRESFWFVPSILIAMALAAAAVMPAVDASIPAEAMDSPALRWFKTTAPRARDTMSVVATSMITVSGIIFSITIVSLSLASSQYGSRLLRTFMADRVTQFSLGLFLATSLYCLLVLRDMRDTEDRLFVPHLSVTLGLAFTVASLGALVYFMHHVAMSIQAPHVVRSVAQDLFSAIERLFPERLGDPPGETEEESRDDGSPALPEQCQRPHAVVAARADGYVQAVDFAGLLAVATEHDLLLRLVSRPGDFMISGQPVARVWPADRLTDEIAARINAAYLVNVRRTPFQDVNAAVAELVETAVRALSPGINDPYTAMSCIDYLAAALCRLAERRIPSPYRHDQEGRLRVIASPTRFPEVLEMAFDQIRQNSRSMVAVHLRMLEALETIGGRAVRNEDRSAVVRQLEMVLRGCEREIPEPHDLAAARERYERALRVCRAACGEAPFLSDAEVSQHDRGDIRVH